ncbi:MAG: orotidine 5'-phosphate decarboxylase / HUMPS family protein [Nanoarchaeota archaeon]|nr:orotidine 5'-phosphate decarboxylase / HUMPS family protein [Nanoarchaeota archaeon]
MKLKGDWDLIKMENNFQQKYIERVQEGGSILCAGLDPAEYGSREGKDVLPKGVNKRDWALKYIEAVAPFCVALKPNTNYWEGIDDVESLGEIVYLAHSKGLVVIEDSKRRDIGSTNDSGFCFTQDKAYDAVTFSPFAGNLEEAALQAHKRDLGLISMCIMSNPEFEKEKNSWIEASYPIPAGVDLKLIDDKLCVRKYVDIAKRSEAAGVDGLVIGAPSDKNHIKGYEIQNVSGIYNGLILVPGVGAQGGEVDLLKKQFSRERLIVNVGRALMFPNGAGSTPKDQAEAAQAYNKMLN